MQSIFSINIFSISFILLLVEAYENVAASETNLSAFMGNSLNPQHRIVNGKDARIQDFPYQLSLRRISVHICGASVLNTFWAISAAHCIDGFEKTPKVFTLRAGSSMRSQGGSLISLSSIYKHPNYNSDTMNYDVALLRTQPNRLRGDFVQPIKLPDIAELIQDDVKATVSGWGHMSSAENVLSPVLKYTTVYIVNQRECGDNMRAHGDITEAMFCAAAHYTDACQGDSGGPIIINDTLIGIVSWGVGCADPHYPGVYTRLAYPAIRRWVKLLTKL